MGIEPGPGSRPVRCGLQLPAQLLAARLLAGLTQAEVARRMGTSASAVSRAENGRTAPTIGFLERYARALGRPLTLRFGLDEVPGRSERYARALRAFGRIHEHRGLLFPAEARMVGLEESPVIEGGSGDITDFYLQTLYKAMGRPRFSGLGRWGHELDTADVVAVAAIWGDSIDWSAVHAATQAGPERVVNARVRRRARAVIAAGIEPQWRPYDRIYPPTTPASGRRVVPRMVRGRLTYA